MDVNELRGKDSPALHEELLGLRREQFNLRMQKATGQLRNAARLRTLRRDIARVKTLLNEKRRAGETS